jgi:hypothetical protein
MPMKTRAGIVSATLAISSRRMSSCVSQFSARSIEVASGARLNQT